MMGRLEMTSAAPQNSGQKVVRAMRELEAREFPGLGTMANVRSEVDDAIEQMRTFYELEPDEVMRLVSGHMARMLEIRVRIERVEEAVPMWRRIRTREVEPVIQDLKAQYDIASRLLTARQLEWEMTREA